MNERVMGIMHNHALFDSMLDCVALEKATGTMREVVHMQAVSALRAGADRRRRCRLPAPFNACVAHSHYAAIATHHMQADITLGKVDVVACDEYAACQVDYLRSELEGVTSEGRVAA